MENLPKCPFGARKCFAFDPDTRCCTALENTQFHPRRGCRFYKTKKENEEQLKKIKERKKTNE